MNVVMLSNKMQPSEDTSIKLKYGMRLRRIDNGKEVICTVVKAWGDDSDNIEENRDVGLRYNKTYMFRYSKFFVISLIENKLIEVMEEEG